MPDTPVEATGHGPYDPGLEVRVTRLEVDMREVKGTLAQMVPVLTRIDATLTSTLPHLATKAELTTAVSDIRSELASAVSDIRSEAASTKSELASAVAGLRSEAASTKSELASAVAGLRSEGARTRSELVTIIAELRTEAANTRSEVVGMIAELRASLADKPSKTYLWAVLGVLVAAMVASYGAGLAAIALR